MVKTTIGAKKYTKKGYRKYSKKATTKTGLFKKYKAPYAKTRFNRVVKRKSALKHSVFCKSFSQIFGDDLNQDQANLNAGIVQLTTVMKGFIAKDPNIFHVSVSNLTLPLGSADALTIGPQIMAAIQTKFRKYTVGIRNNDLPVLAPPPLINYHGVALKFISSVVGTSNNSDSLSTEIPMIYYQASDAYGVKVIPMLGKGIYFKFPKSNEVINNVSMLVRKWPRHLCLFNVQHVRVKVYYSVVTSKLGAPQDGFGNPMNLDIANLG